MRYQLKHGRVGQHILRPEVIHEWQFAIRNYGISIDQCVKRTERTLVRGSEHHQLINIGGSRPGRHRHGTLARQIGGTIHCGIAGDKPAHGMSEDIKFEIGTPQSPFDHEHFLH